MTALLSLLRILPVWLSVTCGEWQRRRHVAGRHTPKTTPDAAPPTAPPASAALLPRPEATPPPRPGQSPDVTPPTANGDVATLPRSVRSGPGQSLGDLVQPQHDHPLQPGRRRVIFGWQREPVTDYATTWPRDGQHPYAAWGPATEPVCAAPEVTPKPQENIPARMRIPPYANPEWRGAARNGDRLRARAWTVQRYDADVRQHPGPDAGICRHPELPALLAARQAGLVSA
jgi:hypothetical protein